MPTVQKLQSQLRREHEKRPLFHAHTEVVWDSPWDVPDAAATGEHADNPAQPGNTRQENRLLSEHRTRLPFLCCSSSVRPTL